MPETRSGRSPGEENGNSLQILHAGESHGQCLAGCSPWGCKSHTQLSDWTTRLHTLFLSLSSNIHVLLVTLSSVKCNILICNTAKTLVHVGMIKEKAIAPHSSTLAWKIPWTEEPGGLQSMGSLWVGYSWATSLSIFTFMHWRGQWQPTPVFMRGEYQGQASLVGCRLWGRTESDTTEVT